MEIVCRAHHALISGSMRLRAERSVRRVARRLPRTVDAVVRFEQDGARRRVEITLHAAGGRRFVAEGVARFFGVALGTATQKLLARTEHLKRNPKSQARRLARA